MTDNGPALPETAAQAGETDFLPQMVRKAVHKRMDSRAGQAVTIAAMRASVGTTAPYAVPAHVDEHVEAMDPASATTKAFHTAARKWHSEAISQ